jgi:hypothetical protein
MSRALLLALALSLGSCAALDPFLGAEVVAVDPVTDEATTTTVGDIIADNAESFGQTAGATATTVTGNPLLGLMLAGAASAIAAAARRKKEKA